MRAARFFTIILSDSFPVNLSVMWSSISEKDMMGRILTRAPSMAVFTMFLPISSTAILEALTAWHSTVVPMAFCSSAGVPS